MQPTTWVEISRAALEANLRAVREHAGVPVCAVVKANAYGHGAAGAARVFEHAGASMLAVTRVDEAAAIRDAGVEAPILVLTPPPEPGDAVKLGCAITVAAASDLERIPRDARVHLKVDTGMGRLGVTPPEAVAVAKRIAEWATLEAVWTHFAGAAGSSGPAQLRRFASVVDAIRGAGLNVLFHAANSAATIALPGARFDMVRIGTLLYGQAPPGIARAPFALADTFAWYAVVSSVKELPAGSTVGYGSEWRARKPTRVATLPVGYADGMAMEPFARTPSLSTAARTAARFARATARFPERAVWFGNQRAPIVGRIAMQETTVSLDGIDASIGVGSVARIPARRLSVNPLIERRYG